MGARNTEMGWLGSRQPWIPWPPLYTLGSDWVGGVNRGRENVMVDGIRTLAFPHTLASSWFLSEPISCSFLLSVWLFLFVLPSHMFSFSLTQREGLKVQRWEIFGAREIFNPKCFPSSVLSELFPVVCFILIFYYEIVKTYRKKIIKNKQYKKHPLILKLFKRYNFALFALDLFLRNKNTLSLCLCIGIDIDVSHTCMKSVCTSPPHHDTPQMSALSWISPFHFHACFYIITETTCC